MEVSLEIKTKLLDEPEISKSSKSSMLRAIYIPMFPSSSETEQPKLARLWP